MIHLTTAMSSFGCGSLVHFFFQAEDGIRDYKVTGVQTCALPISSVHGHWLLARLARTFPDAPFAAPARAALRESLSAENIAAEAKYLRGEGRASFEQIGRASCRGRV